MNERRRSPRLTKVTNAAPSSPTTSSNSQSLNRPKTSRGRVCLLKNIKKMALKSNGDKLNSQTTRCMKNGSKFSNSRKYPAAKNKKKASRKRRRRIPAGNVRALRRSRRLVEQREQNASSRNTLPSSSASQSSTNVSSTQISSIVNSPIFQIPNTSAILSESCVSYLKSQLKKATIKFDKACRQLSMLDQQMNDLQNSYSNSLENERKTFKIIYRMQLATYEGAHTAYIQYIERQVEKIKKLKTLLFNEPNSANVAVTMDFAESSQFAHNSTTNN